MKIQNITEHEICHACLDGLALVSRRKEGNGLADEYGPCPFCEEGERIEGTKIQKKLRWPDGFWQGREPEVIVPAIEKPLSKTENAMRMRLFMARMHGHNTDPCEALDRPERERFAILTERVKALHGS